ncbi:MAG: EFR1 family ferrodoxin [Candidatus Omnitrophota bacterium]
MKITIFYFSGTGNSLKVARDLANELGNTEIIFIPKAMRQGIDLSADRIGLVYPVYMFGLPLVVRDFINQLKTDKSKYIFSVATYGGIAANTLGLNAKLLARQGLKLSAGFLVKMPGNYIPLYEAISREKQDKLFVREQKRIKEIAGVVREGRNRRPEKDAFLFRWLFSYIYKLGSLGIRKEDHGFWVDEKCTSCGICQKVCPVENIRIVSGKPLWLHRCEQCMACLNLCPVEAIQYKKTTQGRKRYKNPYIKIDDLFNH